MKYLYTAALLAVTAINFAQTHEFIKHNGEKLEVNYIKTEEKLVHYSIPNSAEEKTISMLALAQIQDNNKSNSKIVTDKVHIESASDYRKVQSVRLQETSGLQKIGNVSSFLGQAKGETNQAFTDNALKRLQQLAAKKGAPFMVITSNKPQNLKADLYSY
ncbi:YdgH/BhsA/McbA family protein [Flavobacterium turcicum]|uniref:Uncharacterized protein n=1 Tax=Flavobacterium turcicum TaxID=2764718 RepID=A0ABR7JFE8_9FLAO|nr:hypothetical protein [Flavobacterium turcicum]MBC5863225.1 hypothetical protein [Flavobacterium turcicum]NHL01957.1 hypothetical protein [Flavobacterium turcicum]